MGPLAFEVSAKEGIGEKLDVLAALGISHVGLGEVYPVWYYPPRNASPYLSVSDTKRHVCDRRMQVVTVHGVGGFVTPDPSQQAWALAHLKIEVERAAELGSPVIVFHFRQPAIPWAPGEMAIWTRTIIEYGPLEYDKVFAHTAFELCEHAERLGVTVHLETMGPPFSFGQCVDQVIPLLRQVNHKRLGICIDSGHLHCSGHDPAEQIVLARGLPITLHLNDNFGPIPPNYDIYDGDLHLVPGFGTIPWPEVILALRHVQYAGPLFFEGVRIAAAGFAECVERTIANWQVFQKLADNNTTLRRRAFDH